MIIGVDLGTQTCRSIMFDEDGRKIVASSASYDLKYVKPRWVEQDPNDWWNAVKTTLRNVMMKSKASPTDIDAISFSSQANALVLLDGDGEPVYPVISWLDTRSEKEVEFLRERLTEENIYKTTGMILAPGFSPPKILWVKRNLPSIFSKIRKIVFTEDYIIYKLAGEFAIDYSLISFSMLFDVNKACWAHDILDTIGVTPDMFSKPYPSGTLIGELTAEVADEIGLKRGTPIIVGGHDQCCAAVGAGVIEHGMVLNSIGTAQATLCVSDKPFHDSKMRVLRYIHALPERKWVLLRTISSAGILLRWFCENFCSAEAEVAKGMETSPYSLLDREAEAIEPGSEGLFVIPFFDEAEGVIYGLSLSHGKPHLYRALLESIGFEVRRSIDIIEDLGITVRDIRMVGGGAKSLLWRKIISNQTNKTISVPRETEAAALGAAILAGVGAKVYKDVYDGVKNAVKIIDSEKPEEDIVAIYDSAFKKYLEIVNRLRKS